MDVVLPHPGMLPSGPGIASPECSRRHVSLSIDYAGPGACGVTQTGFPVRSASLLSCPDLALPKSRRAAEGIGRSGATRSHAQRAVAREHGEDGEHQTFPEVSTVAHLSPVGGSHPRTPTPQAQRLGRSEESLRNLSGNYLDTHRLFNGNLSDTGGIDGGNPAGDG